jgi:predicted dehydrogenase
MTGGIAIVGRGAMGTTHARALISLGRTNQIKYLITRTASNVADALPHASVIHNLDIALNDSEIDVVSICTPTGTHRDLAVRALRAGKNVLLEKPMALTMQDALAIREEAIHSGKIFMTAQVVRFFSGYRKLRDDAATGKLGRLVSARATRLINKPDRAEWLRDFTEAGGMLVDLGVHDFDQMNLLLGEPMEVSATGTAITGPVETTITYRDGGVGNVLTYADLPKALAFRSSIEAIGTLGFAHYEFAPQAATAPQTQKIGSSESPQFNGVSRYSITTSGFRSEILLDPEEPYARQLEYFLKCVEDGAEPGFCPTSAALAALQVALAARKSLALGVPVIVESLMPSSSE